MNACDNAPRRRTETLSLRQVSPDQDNRRVKHDETLKTLAESIRVLGVLSPVHVWPVAEGRYRIIDGERRWRAAKAAELEEVPCIVWANPEEAQRDGVLAGIALNEHREAHGCLAVARRLRQFKNEHGVTLEELAGRTSLPLDRVKSYFSLLRGGSDEMFRFFEEENIPLKTAVEFVRYQKRTNEAMARKLIKKYRDCPMGWKVIASMDKAKKKRAAGKAVAKSALEQAFSSLKKVSRREPEHALVLLRELALELGFELSPQRK